MPDVVYKGKTQPRIWTKPLRKLTAETSRGFEVIDFAREVLKIELYPWQQWLLIHALEILEDGAYRFRQVIVLVARQNGKSLLASVLAAWWLYVDSRRFAAKVPPVTFKIIGTAQNLDIAREVWSLVRAWSNYEPESIEEEKLVIPMLAASCKKINTANDNVRITGGNLAHYEIKALKSARGKPAARVIMDEIREQTNWTAWNAVTHTSRSFWSHQLWGISNAGDAKSVVLKARRDHMKKMVEDWDTYVGAGLVELEAYANDPAHDMSLGLFEWSAPDGCAMDDIEAILQANPSIGFGEITVAQCISEAHASETNEAGYRTEVLCQWVEAKTEPYISPLLYEQVIVDSLDVRKMIEPGARTVWGIDTSISRAVTYIASAVMTTDGKPFVQLWEQKAGMLWVVDYMKDLVAKSGMNEIALQTKGCPAMEFAPQLEDLGFMVHRVDGGLIGSATGRFKDRVRDKDIVMVDQPALRLAFEGGLTAMYAENEAWSRRKSLTDVAPAIAVTLALYGLETTDPVEPIGDPPSPAVVKLDPEAINASGLVNLATVHF